MASKNKKTVLGQDITLNSHPTFPLPLSLTHYYDQTLYNFCITKNAETNKEKPIFQA